MRGLIFLFVMFFSSLVFAYCPGQIQKPHDVKALLATKDIKGCANSDKLIHSAIGKSIEWGEYYWAYKLCKAAPVQDEKESCAVAAMRIGRLEEAQAYLKGLIRDKGADKQTYLDTAKVAAGQFRFNLAARVLDWYGDKGDRDVLKTQGIYYLKADREKQAYKNFVKLLEKDGSVEEFKELLHLLSDFKANRYVIDMYRRFSKRYPLKKDFDTIRVVLEACSKAGKKRLAKKVVEEYLKSRPSQEQVAQLVSVLEDLGMFKLALKVIDTQRIENAQILFLKGRALVSLKKGKKAIKYLLKYVKQSKNRQEAFFNALSELTDADLNKEAQEFVNRVFPVMVDTDDAALRVARLYTSLDKKEKAWDVLHRQAKRSGVDFLIRVANEYIRLRGLEIARRALNSALKIAVNDTKKADILYKLIKVESVMAPKVRKQAMEHLQMFLTLHHYTPKQLKFLISISKRFPDPEKVKMWLLKAQNQKVSSKDDLLELFRLQLRLGNVRGATDTLKKLLDYAAKDANVALEIIKDINATHTLTIGNLLDVVGQRKDKDSPVILILAAVHGFVSNHPLEAIGFVKKLYSKKLDLKTNKALKRLFVVLLKQLKDGGIVEQAIQGYRILMQSANQKQKSNITYYILQLCVWKGDRCDKEIDQYLQYNGRDAKSFMKIGELFEQNYRVEEAYKWFYKAYKAEPDNFKPMLMAKLTVLAAKENRLGEFLDKENKGFLKWAKGNPEKLWPYIKALIRTARFKKAYEIIKSAGFEHFMNRGMNVCALKEMFEGEDAAKGCISRAIKGNPDVAIEYVRHLEDMGKDKEAFEWLKQVDEEKLGLDGLVMKIGLMLDMGEFSKAMDVLVKHLDEFGNSPWLCRAFGEFKAYGKAQKLFDILEKVKGVDTLNFIVNNCPDFATSVIGNMLIKGKGDVVKGLVDDAKKDMDLARDTIRVLERLGLGYELKELVPAIIKAKNTPVGLDDMVWKYGLGEDLKRVLRDMLKGHGNDSVVRLFVAKKALDMGDVDMAYEAFKGVKSLTPDNSEVWLRMVKVLWTKGKKKKAIEAVGQLIEKLSPDVDMSGFFNDVVTNILNGARPQDVMDLVGEAENKTGSVGGLYGLVGYMYLVDNNPKKAYEYLEKALKASDIGEVPSKSDVYFKRFFLYELLQGNVDRFKDLLGKKFNWSYPLANLKIRYLCAKGRMKDAEDAAGDLAERLSVTGNYGNVYAARILFECGDFDGAARFALKGMKRPDITPQAFGIAALLYVKALRIQGKDVDIDDIMDVSKERFGDVVANYERLANLLNKAGMYGAAYKVLKKRLKMDGAVTDVSRGLLVYQVKNKQWARLIKLWKFALQAGLDNEVRDIEKQILQTKSLLALEGLIRAEAVHLRYKRASELILKHLDDLKGMYGIELIRNGIVYAALAGNNSTGIKLFERYMKYKPEDFEVLKLLTDVIRTANFKLASNLIAKVRAMGVSSNLIDQINGYLNIKMGKGAIVKTDNSFAWKWLYNRDNLMNVSGELVKSLPVYRQCEEAVTSCDIKRISRCVDRNYSEMPLPSVSFIGHLGMLSALYRCDRGLGVIMDWANRHTGLFNAKMAFAFELANIPVDAINHLNPALRKRIADFIRQVDVRLVSSHPEEVWYSSLMAQVKGIGGDWKAAAREFFRLVRLYPSNGLIRNNTAYFLSLVGLDYDRALKVIKEARILDPSQDAYYAETMAWLLFKMGKKDEALKLEKAVLKQFATINSGEGISEGLYHLGLIYLDQGKKEEALKAFRLSQYLYPSNPFAIRSFFKIKSILFH